MYAKVYRSYKCWLNRAPTWVRLVVADSKLVSAVVKMAFVAGRRSKRCLRKKEVTHG
jgi:hypothetical protein